MDSILTESSISTIVPLSAGTPGVTLEPADWLLLGTVSVADGGTITLDAMDLSLLEIASTDPTVAMSGPNVVNQSFVDGGLVSLFVISAWNPTTEPWNQSVVARVVLPVDSTQAALAVAPQATSQLFALPGSGPVTWSAVLLNNSTNRNLAVAGRVGFTLDTDPAT